MSYMPKRAFLLGVFTMLSVQPQALHGSEKAGLDALYHADTFARIPAGTFRMGYAKGLDDEGPEHEVRIGAAFELGKVEVTQAQWEAVMRDPHKPMPADGAVGATPSHFKGANLPVESVSWDDVQLFLQRLNERESTYKFRLPTEAEWEYASRAGAKPQASLKDAEEEAWFKGNAGDTTHAIGGKKPNHWGLYDMDGNVAEWVSDWYGADYYAGSPHTDPKGPSTGSYRVFKGGAWLTDAALCRPTIRNFDFPNSRFYHVGFRLVRAAK